MFLDNVLHAFTICLYLLSLIKFIHDFPGHRDKENLIHNFISMLNWCVYLSVCVSVCLFVCYSRMVTIVFSS